MLGKNERGTGFLIPATERRLCPVFFSCARGTRKTRHPLLGRTRLASQRRGTLVQVRKGTQERLDGALGKARTYTTYMSFLDDWRSGAP